MKKTLFLVLFFSFSLCAIDSKVLSEIPNTPAPWIVRAYYDNQQQLQSLSDITALWQINKNQKFALLMIEDRQMFNKIQLLKIKVRLEEKLQNKYFIKNEKLDNNHLPSGGNTINGFSCYSTVEDTFSRMQILVDDNPTLAEIIEIGVSWEKSTNINNGYDLKVLKITNKNIVADKPIVFITSAIHAREYATAELTTRFAEYLLSQYNTNSDIRWMLDHHEVQLLLQTNPDGRKKAESGILWRKNTNQAYCSPNSNNRGADLNRNYPFLWQGGNDQCAETFPGGSAQSEPEVSSIMNHLYTIYADNRGELITDAAADDTPGVFLDIHSFSQLVLWPWGFTSNDNPNVSQYEAFGRRVAYFNGYTPEPITDLTIADGGSIDASYGELGVASLAFELGTDFFQDCETFESTLLPDNLDALLYVTRVARTPYISPLGPDIEELKVVPNYVLPNQSFSISGIANEDRYNHSHGSQTFDQVQQVDLYVDDLPWIQQNSQSIPASDGSYDSALELFNTQINGNQLSVGQHIIYIVGKDSNNAAGAVYSKFLNVVDENQVGTLSGIVTDAITGAVIDSAQLEMNQSFALTDVSGHYSLLVPPATDTLFVNANGYSSKLLNNIEVIQQQSIIQNVQLEPFCSVFSDDIETGVNGWTANAPWAIVNSQSASPTHSWTDSPNGNYADNINKAITSSPIVVSGAESLEVSFKHLCNTEAGFDFGHVEVKFDNNGWQNLLTCDGQTMWKSENKSLLIPKNSQQMQLRFRLTSDGFITQDGWYIDDINVKVSGQPCRSVFNDTIFKNDFE